MPAASVILPFRNAESTLKAALDSVSAQTFADWELIAYDDGSTDASREIAEHAARDDPRIRVLDADGTPSHVGLIEALRRACDAATAPILIRMDADDVCHPERFQRQIDLLRAQPDTVTCGTLVQMTGSDIGSGRRRYENWINHLINHEEMVRELFIECPLPHPTFAMRADAYHAIGGYQDHGWPEDYDLVFRFWRHGGQLAKVNDVLLDWQDHPTRHSMAHPRYEEAAFRRCKRHYLQATYLSKDTPFIQWGAGEVGKRWLREWSEKRPDAVVGIHPRKIGCNIHGYPVIAPDDLPAPGEKFLVIMVGAPGARKEIRDYLSARDYQEITHYLFLA